jgi:hypothetical protein
MTKRSRRLLATTPAAFLAVALLLVAWMWLTDFITVQGERTIYTVDCRGGEWKGALCTGKLAASDRYRFRALRRRGEVLFWRPRVLEPSGRFAQCRIDDGRNWICPPSVDAPRSITLALDHGRAVHDEGARTRAFHGVEKWRWLLLDWGLYGGHSADY